MVLRDHRENFVQKQLALRLTDAVDFFTVGTHRVHTLPASHWVSTYDWMDGRHRGTNIGWRSTRPFFEALSRGMSFVVHWLRLRVRGRETLQKGLEGFGEAVVDFITRSPQCICIIVSGPTWLEATESAG